MEFERCEKLLNGSKCHKTWFSSLKEKIIAHVCQEKEMQQSLVTKKVQTRVLSDYMYNLHLQTFLLCFKYSLICG